MEHSSGEQVFLSFDSPPHSPSFSPFLSFTSLCSIRHLTNQPISHTTIRQRPLPPPELSNSLNSLADQWKLVRLEFHATHTQPLTDSSLTTLKMMKSTRAYRPALATPSAASTSRRLASHYPASLSTSAPPPPPPSALYTPSTTPTPSSDNPTWSDPGYLARYRNASRHDVQNSQSSRSNSTSKILAEASGSNGNGKAQRSRRNRIANDALWSGGDYSPVRRLSFFHPRDLTLSDNDFFRLSRLFLSNHIVHKVQDPNMHSYFPDQARNMSEWVTSCEKREKEKKFGVKQKLHLLGLKSGGRVSGWIS